MESFFREMKTHEELFREWQERGLILVRKDGKPVFTKEGIEFVLENERKLREQNPALKELFDFLRRERVIREYENNEPKPNAHGSRKSFLVGDVREPTYFRYVEPGKRPGAFRKTRHLLR